jgi:hypothetical protein
MLDMDKGASRSGIAVLRVTVVLSIDGVGDTILQPANDTILTRLL